MPVAKKKTRAKPAPHRIVPPAAKTAADADPRVDAPRVEYRLTKLGETLGMAFGGVWEWASKHLDNVHAARAAFDTRASATAK